MHNDCHHFSMSILIFIEDNKMNEHGEDFSRKLKFFKIFCIPSFGILCMILFLNM